MTGDEASNGSNSVRSLSSSESVKGLGTSELSEEVSLERGSLSPNANCLRAVLTGVTTRGSDGPAIRSNPVNVGI